jgi:hypothetical protein
MMLAGKKVTAMAGLAAAAYLESEADFKAHTGLDAKFINCTGFGHKDGQAMFPSPVPFFANFS